MSNPNRTVIYDSEDEDAGFSPISSPLKGDGDATDCAIALDHDAGDRPQLEDSVVDQRSTDPDFFQKVYDEQQHVSDSTRTEIAEAASSDGPKSSALKANNSSSITDPTLDRAGRKAKALFDAKDFVNMTQVTTPRNDGSSGIYKDVYEFPTSDGDGGHGGTRAKPKATKTYSKRKRGLDQIETPVAAIPSSSPALPFVSNQGLSLAQVQDDDEEQSPKPARKKRRNGSQKSTQVLDERVDLLVVPRTAQMKDSPAGPEDGNSGQGSVVPDTLDEHQDTANQIPASLFVVPPNHLTTSQKQEYMCVSGSAEHDNALLAPHLDTQAQRIRSSEATIAYTTPSRYCSSAPGFPEEPDNNGRDLSFLAAPSSNVAQNRELYPMEPQSSPDELDSHSPGQLRLDTKKRRGMDRVDKQAQVEPWDPDEMEDRKEQYVESYKPRPRRQRSRAALDEGDEGFAAPEQSAPDPLPPGQANAEGVGDAEPILVSSGQEAVLEGIDPVEGIDAGYLAALPEEIRQEVIADQLARNSQILRTRSRGRASQGGSSHVEPTEETPQPKKRGRKKKETVHEDASTVAEEDGMLTAAAPTNTAKKKRGRPRKSETTQPPPSPAAGDEDISLAYEVGDMCKAADEVDAAGAQSPQAVEDAPVASRAAPTRAASKRGRKRRFAEETAVVPGEEPSFVGAGGDVQSESLQEATEETKVPSKRGRKKKVVQEEAPVDEIKDAVEGSEGELEAASDAEGYSKAEAGVKRRALVDISNTASSQGRAEGAGEEEEEEDEATAGEVVDKKREDTAEAEAEAEAKGTPKLASSATLIQQGKAPLRVGLSKRSRIAPLLKMIRK